MKVKLFFIFTASAFAGLFATVSRANPAEESAPVEERQNEDSPNKESDSERLKYFEDLIKDLKNMLFRKDCETALLREENLRLRQELQVVRKECARLRQERDFTDECLRKFALQLGFRNPDKKDLEEILCDIRCLEKTSIRSPKSGILSIDEWESARFFLEGCEEIIEKIKGYEDFVKKYQNKEVIILENQKQ